MAKLSGKLTVVIPPWAPRYDRASDRSWREKDGAYVKLVDAAGRACGFGVIDLPAIAALTQADYANEMHVKASVVPIYTRELVKRLNDHPAV